VNSCNEPSLNVPTVDEMSIIQTGAGMPNDAKINHLFTWTKLSFKNIGFLTLKKYEKYFKNII
jgi:hypothetical protein